MHNAPYFLDIKKYLDENQIDVFCISDIYNIFIDYNKRRLKRAIQNIVKLEYSEIERGKFVRRTFKNEYVIGNILTDDAVIAYWSALNIHGLTEQFPNKIYIQTTKNKKNKVVFGTSYQFIKINPKKMIGIIKHGIGTNQFKITDIEKTIIDCFDLVKYSGGFMELIRALKRTKLDAKKMIEYTEAIENMAAIKRIAYLSELFNKKELKPFIKFAKTHKSKNFDLLDIFGDEEGEYDSEWNLRLNINKENLIEIANSIY